MAGNQRRVNGWRAFWLAWTLALPLLDPWREQADIAADRDHMDGTTCSSTWRWLLAKIPGGKWLFRGFVGWLAGWLPGHITDHMDSQRARW